MAKRQKRRGSPHKKYIPIYIVAFILLLLVIAAISTKPKVNLSPGDLCDSYKFELLNVVLDEDGGLTDWDKLSRESCLITPQVVKEAEELCWDKNECGYQTLDCGDGITEGYCEFRNWLGIYPTSEEGICNPSREIKDPVTGEIRKVPPSCGCVMEIECKCTCGRISLERLMREIISGKDITEREVVG